MRGCAALLRRPRRGRSSPTRRSTPRRSTRARPTPATCRSGWCWRSCRGTSRSGRRCGSPRPRWRRATSGLLKHASNVPQTALFMEDLFREAGFPDDVFQTLLIGSGKVERVIKDDRVAAATLTGSEGAGVAVGRTAGESLKKVVLELGGSDAFVVMPSADLAQAAKVATISRMPEQRPVVHLGEALHRARRRLRRVHGALHQGDVRPRGRRPDGGGHRRRPARHRAGPRGRRGAGQGRRRQGCERGARR